MSGYDIIRDVSEEMRRQVYDALNNVSDHDFNLGNIDQMISLLPPGDRISGNAVRLSVFLYHVEVDPHNRNQPTLRVPPRNLRRPPLPIHLHFLITALTDEEDTNQLMMGRILQYFYFNPIIDSIDGDPIGDSYGGGLSELRITFESLPVPSLQSIWNMLDEPYHLSLSFNVTPVAIDSDLGAVEGARVEEAHTIVGHKGNS